MTDLELQRQVPRLHQLGPRPLYEILVELGAQRLISGIERLVKRHVDRLDPAILKALGANCFSPIPMRVIDGCER